MGSQVLSNGLDPSDIPEVLGWRDITMLRRCTAEVAQETGTRPQKGESRGQLEGADARVKGSAQSATAEVGKAWRSGAAWATTSALAWRWA
jgi:hypothetical protein